MSTIEELRTKAAALKVQYESTGQAYNDALKAKRVATDNVAVAQRANARAHMQYQRVMGALAIEEDNET